MRKQIRSGRKELSFSQLSFPLQHEPFLKVKKKLREKDSRAAIDGIEKNAILLKFKLETGAIQSPEAQQKIRQFLEVMGLL